MMPSSTGSPGLSQCPVCRMWGDFGLLRDENGNLMCPSCYERFLRARGPKAVSTAGG